MTRPARQVRFVSDKLEQAFLAVLNATNRFLDIRIAV